jgi:chaperonin GroES
MQLLHDNILVKRLENATQTKGGLYVPQTADSPYFKYLVLSTGPGRKNKKTGVVIPMDVKAGDLVLAAKFNGTDILVDGETYYILTSQQILAVLGN